MKVATLFIHRYNPPAWTKPTSGNMPRHTLKTNICSNIMRLIKKRGPDGFLGFNILGCGCCKPSSLSERQVQLKQYEAPSRCDHQCILSIWCSTPLVLWFSLACALSHGVQWLQDHGGSKFFTHQTISRHQPQWKVVAVAISSLVSMA
jgi:hypothetical protein